MLNENALLIKIVTEYQNKGKVHECIKYQDILTRNLLYLAGVSDIQVDENFSPTKEKQKQAEEREQSFQDAVKKE